MHTYAQHSKQLDITNLKNDKPKRHQLPVIVVLIALMLGGFGATLAHAQTNNLIQDPGFELQGNVSGENLAAPWSGVGANDTSSWTGVDVSVGVAHSGIKDGFIYSSAANPWVAITQTVTSNVAANTNYTLTGWINNSNSAGLAGGFFGVKATSGTVIAQTAIPLTTPYVQLTVNFNSGSNTSLVVFAGYTPSGGSSWMHLDDVSLVNPNLIEDPGFERQGNVSGEPLAAPWSGVGANHTSSWTGVDVNVGTAHSGIKDGFIYSSGANPWVGFTQTVTSGVAANTNYTLTGWVNNSTTAGFAGGFFGVKTTGGTVIAQTAIPLTAPYVQLSVNFNSGSYTTLVVFAGYTPAGGSSWMHLDDVSLVSAPSGPPGPPTISSISPTSGPTSGGTIVTLSGSNFESGASVKFGSINSSAVTFINSAQVNAMSPAEPAGSVSVTIANPDPESATLPSAFTYTAGPTISGVSPNSGPSTGGTTVTINGSGFKSGATVAFGTLFAVSVTVSSSTQIQAVTSSESAGLVGITVTNPDLGTASLPSAFTFLPVVGQQPTIKSATTDPGAANSSASCVNQLPVGATHMCTLTITGSNFQGGATVTLGAAGAATNVNVVNSTTITATVPTYSTPDSYVNITVTNPGGLSATLTNGFFYGKIYFQDGFEEGNFNAWSQYDGTGGFAECVANSGGTCQNGAVFTGSGSGYSSSSFVCPNPTPVHSGNYVACQYYNLGEPGDTDSALRISGINGGNGLGHFFHRDFVYFPTPVRMNAGGEANMQRKVLPTTNGVEPYSFILGTNDGAGSSPGPFDLATFTNQGASVNYGCPGYAENRWYELEIEVQLNSTNPLTQNGYGNFWVNGNFGCSLNNVWVNGSSTQLASVFTVGQQVNDGYTGGGWPWQEYRYVDDVVIADAYIP